MEKKKIAGIVILLSVLLIIPYVFSSGLVNMAGVFYSNNAAESGGSTLSTTNVFVTPANTVDSHKQPGNFSTFTVHINISSVTDLFSWQLNLTYNPSIVSVKSISAGEFLMRTDSENKTSSHALHFVVNKTDNVKGYSGMAETILEDKLPGNVPGVTGVSGRLVSVEFLVVGYGWTWLNISRTGNLAATLLNSTVLPSGQPGTISFTNSNGWFDNRIRGDVNSDKIVTVTDAGLVSDYWTSPPGLYPYKRYVDLNLDGVVSVTDAGIVSDNWGKSTP